MARPLKQSIDYFPLDVRFDDKINFFTLETKGVGLALLIKIWQKTYGGDKGYYLIYDKFAKMSLVQELGLTQGQIDDLIKLAVESYELFDINILKRYSVLTSKAIQKRYFEAAKRKVSIKCEPEYLLVDISEYPNVDCSEKTAKTSRKRVSVNNTPQNDAKTTVSVGINSQSKVKKSKVKETKVNNNNNNIYNKEKEKTSKKEKEKDFPSQLLKTFKSTYKEIIGVEYLDLGRDKSNLMRIFNKLKSLGTFEGLNSEESLEKFKKFCELVLESLTKFDLENFSVDYFIRNLNKFYVRVADKLKESKEEVENPFSGW